MRPDKISFPIKTTVYCPISKKEVVVFTYSSFSDGKASVECEGCDDSNGSEVCNSCKRETESSILNTLFK